MCFIKVVSSGFVLTETPECNFADTLLRFENEDFDLSACLERWLHFRGILLHPVFMRWHLGLCVLERSGKV